MAFLDDYEYCIYVGETVRIRVKDKTKTSYANIPETFVDDGVTYTVRALNWAGETGNDGTIRGCFQDCVNLKTIPSIPSGVTDMYACFYGCSSLTSLPASFTIPSGVTDMQGCFRGCSSLTSFPASFTMPSSVRRMTSCFRGCSSLTSLPSNFTIPSSVTDMQECFRGCSSLTSLPSNFTIPSSVTDMQRCFRGCSSLTSLPSNFTIPSGVTNLSQCFYLCSSLTSLPSNFTISSGVTNMQGCFHGCSSLTSLPSNFTIPSSVTDMSDCFGFCRSLTSLPSNFTIPSGVTNLSQCFYLCSSLTSLPSNFTIPSSVTNMQECFRGCWALTSLSKNFTIPPSVTDMSDCFYDCESLTSLPPNFTIPSSVTHIEWCFSGCSSLTSLPSNFTIPSSVTNLSYCFYQCSSLTSFPSNFTIPSGVTDMEDCFHYCSSLTSLPSNFTIPSSVTDMQECFRGCSSLTSLPSNFTIPSGVTDMQGCFRGCSSLTSLPTNFTIPASVSTMAYCFYDCSNLESIPKIVEGVTSMSYSFYGCKKLKKSPTIPSTVILMDGCFSTCTSLEDPPVTLPSGLVDMDRCFYGTKITKSPEIPNTVTDMELCFCSCYKLETAPKIPASVKNIKSCFKYCSSLGGYVLFEADPDTYDDAFYSTNEEIRLVVPTNASNYNKAVLIASKFSNVQVDSNFSLFPPPAITEVVCKRVGGKGLLTERRQGDWVYYRVKFKNFIEFLPGNLQVPEPPIPEIKMYADGKLIYNDWINKSSDPNAVSDDSDVDETGDGGWDNFSYGGASGDKPNYYEQEFEGWIKFTDPQAAHNIGFQIEGYYDKNSDLIYKIVTSTFKVLDIAAPNLNEGGEYDVYSKSTFAMGIGTLASREGQLSIGIPTTFEDGFNSDVINTRYINSNASDGKIFLTRIDDNARYVVIGGQVLSGTDERIIEELGHQSSTKQYILDDAKNGSTITVEYWMTAGVEEDAQYASFTVGIADSYRDNQYVDIVDIDYDGDSLISLTLTDETGYLDDAYIYSVEYTKNLLKEDDVTYISGTAGEGSSIYVKRPESHLNAAKWNPSLTLQSYSGGGWSLGTYDNDNLKFVYGSKANIDSDTNSVTALEMTPDGGLILGNGTTASLAAKTPGRGNGVVFLTVGGGKTAAGDINGTALRIGAGGLTIIGGGEYASPNYDLSGRYARGDLNDGTEDLYLGADGTVYIESNANSVHDTAAANRKTAFLNTSGNFVLKNYDATRGTNPSSNLYRTFEMHDKDGRRLAILESGVINNSTSILNLKVLGHYTSADAYGGLIIKKTLNNTNNADMVYDANTGALTVPGTLTQKGQRVMNAISANGYWGLATPDNGTGTGDWIRTTQAGLIPYSANTAGVSQIGTSSWPFSNGYFHDLNVTAASNGAYTNLRNSVVNASVNGKVVTFTKANGGTFTITTQDTNTNTAKGTFYDVVYTGSCGALAANATQTVSTSLSGSDPGGTATGAFNFYTSHPTVVGVVGRNGGSIYIRNMTSTARSAGYVTITNQIRRLVVST